MPGRWIKFHKAHLCGGTLRANDFGRQPWWKCRSAEPRQVCRWCRSPLHYTNANKHGRWQKQGCGHIFSANGSRLHESGFPRAVPVLVFGNEGTAKRGSLFWGLTTIYPQSNSKSQQTDMGKRNLYANRYKQGGKQVHLLPIRKIPLPPFP